MWPLNTVTGIIFFVAYNSYFSSKSGMPGFTLKQIIKYHVLGKL